MAKRLQLRRGTTQQHGSFTGSVGECTVDTDKDTLVVHDGSQAGGRPLAREDLNNVSSATIISNIDDDAVTFAKLQNVAANRMLGNNTGNAADAIELTAAQVRTFLNVEDDADANVATNLGQTTAANQLTITSSTGDNVVIAEATGSIAGLMSTTHHDKLDGIAAGAQVNVATNLGQTTAANQLTITSSTGDDVVIAEATGSIAGLMSTTHHDKLDGIATGAEVNVATNLGQTTGANSLTITSSTGNNVTVAEASSTIAGLMSTAHHDKLDGIATSANNYSHPNHSGEVTSSGDGATTISDNVVDEANLKISNAGSDGQFLQKQSGNTGGLTWATVSTQAFPSGTKMLFNQTAAPTSWTKDTTNNNDSAIRVVTGSVGTGGSDGFSSTFGSGKTTSAHTLSTSEMPAHTHYHQMGNANGSSLWLQAMYRNPAWNFQAGNLTSSSTGGGGSHSHNLSNFNLKFVDVIVCTAD